jgi:hypothetical protein
MGHASVILAVAFVATSQAVTTMVVSPPRLVCELDLDQLKGSPRRMSWAPNDESLHLQTLDGDVAYDYMVTVTDGILSIAFGEPEWAVKYWARKSDLAAPGDPTLKLEVTVNNRRTRATPFQNGFSNGGAQTWDPKNASDLYEQEVIVRFLGKEIGNWINGAPMAGETFGWGPDGSGAIVFVDNSGHLSFVDRGKRIRTVPGVRNAILPAWSTNGSGIAFLERASKKKYRLLVATVSPTR